MVFFLPDGRMELRVRVIHRLRFIKISPVLFPGKTDSAFDSCMQGVGGIGQGQANTEGSAGGIHDMMRGCEFSMILRVIGFML